MLWITPDNYRSYSLGSIDLDRYLAGRKRIAAKTLILDKRICIDDRLFIASVLTRTGIYSARSGHSAEKCWQYLCELLEANQWDFKTGYYKQIEGGEYDEYRNL